MEIPGLFSLCIDIFLHGDYDMQVCQYSYLLKETKATSKNGFSKVFSGLNACMNKDDVLGLFSCVLKKCVRCHTSHPLDQLVTSVLAKCECYLQLFYDHKMIMTQHPCNVSEHQHGRTKETEGIVKVKHKWWNIISLNSKTDHSSMCASEMSNCVVTTNIEECRDENTVDVFQMQNSREFNKYHLKKVEYVEFGQREISHSEINPAHIDERNVFDSELVFQKASSVRTITRKLLVPRGDPTDVNLLKQTNILWFTAIRSQTLFVIPAYESVRDFRMFIRNIPRCKRLSITRNSNSIFSTEAITIAIYLRHDNEYRLLTRLLVKSILPDSKTITANKMKYQLLSRMSTKLEIRNLYHEKKTNKDTASVLSLSASQSGSLIKRKFSTFPRILKVSAPMFSRRTNDDGCENEVLRMKACINNVHNVLVKQKSRQDAESTTRVRASLNYIRLKPSKPKLEAINKRFKKKRHIFMDRPEGLLPCQTLREIKVNMLPTSEHGIRWALFEKETMRLASFAYYPTSAKKTATELANSGFVYIGNGTNDRVKCYFCSAEKELWTESDNVDSVHMLMSPSCPMVLIQNTNNVSSNVSPLNVSGIANFSSAMLYTSNAPTSEASNVDNSATSQRLSDPNTVSGNSCSVRDEVDWPREDIHEQRAAVRAHDPQSTGREYASSLLTSANVSSCTTPSINTQRDSAAVSGLLQDYINSSLSNSSAMMHSMNQSMNNVSENDNVNGSRNRSFQNIENRTTNQFQQHISSSNQQGISHHPNINSQVYSIPANSIQTNTPASETPTGTLTTSQSSLATSNSAQPTFQLTYQLLGIFHERPKYTDYAVVSRRFQSFESWPADHPIKKDDLIKSGLFFAGYGDCCRCFFCGGGLRNWEVEDDPFVEHARWFDKCSYIRQFMGHEFVLAVQSLKSRGGTITLRDVTEHMQAMGQTIQNLFADRTLTDDAAVRSLIDSGYDSESVVQAAQSLRDSGELLSADVILRQIREKLTGSGANATSGTESIPDDEGIPDQGRLQALKEENYALRSNLICKICMDKEVRIVFLPCGHLVSCQECAVALQDCPVCRSHIRATARANIR